MARNHRGTEDDEIEENANTRVNFGDRPAGCKDTTGHERKTKAALVRSLERRMQDPGGRLLCG